MDETVLREPYRGPSEDPPSIRVRVEGGPTQTFTESFTIGRGEESTLQVDAELASRVHIEVLREADGWILRDRKSTNGTFKGDEQVGELSLEGRVTVRLGRTGPSIEFFVGDASDEEVQEDETGLVANVGHGLEGISTESRVIEHYFGGGSSRPMGERTQMIRRAYTKVKQKEQRKYGTLIGAAVVLLLAALTVVIVQRRNLAKLEASAEEVFYLLKEQDLQIAQIRLIFEETRGAFADIPGGTPGDSTGDSLSGGFERTNPWEAGGISLEAQLAALQERRAATAEQYDAFVEQAGVYRGLTDEEREIYRVARIFNESEFTIPAGFVAAVQQYIGYWKGSSRFENAVRRAQQSGYIPEIVAAFERYGLPPEFFYLGLQESNFDPCAVGPSTRWGIAKGMWQFIPDTGRRYGLHIGPRATERVCDPEDDRHDYAKAADASAHYLLDIYTQLAEASGLLAMASYNWGEHRIIPRLAGLPRTEEQEDIFEGIPKNPQQRSYWRFLNEYSDRMPEQTKDYVLYIVSAAVIGQNPRLFGFDFDNPLEPYIGVSAAASGDDG